MADMYSYTCRYCTLPVFMEKRSDPRTHPECRAAANKCRHCDQVVPLPHRVHRDCQIAANKKTRELAADLTRRCSKCRKVKSPTSFSDDRTRKDGKFPWCMTCQAASTSAGRFQDPDAELNGHVCPLCDTPIRGHANRRFCSHKCKQRCRDLKTKFNMSVADYRRLVAATDGRCPICRNRCKAWHVDHNHSTGKVTGVVCVRCNVGMLAYSNHLVERAQALVDYLTETPAQKLGIEVVVPPNIEPKNSNLHKMWGFATSRV